MKPHPRVLCGTAVESSSHPILSSVPAEAPGRAKEPPPVPEYPLALTSVVTDIETVAMRTLRKHSKSRYH